MRRVVHRSAIRSLRVVRDNEARLIGHLCAESVDCGGDQAGIAQGCAQVCSELKPLRRLLIPAHNPGWESERFPFSEKTPEESDEGFPDRPERGFLTFPGVGNTCIYTSLASLGVP